jgi:hypothetical protein
MVARIVSEETGGRTCDCERHSRNAPVRANDRALRDGGRLLSAYRTARGTRLWVITEADRSSTCILLPEEY